VRETEKMEKGRRKKRKERGKTRKKHQKRNKGSGKMVELKIFHFYHHVPLMSGSKTFDRFPSELLITIGEECGHASLISLVHTATSIKKTLTPMVH
jgi:hypothetical protein